MDDYSTYLFDTNGDNLDSLGALKSQIVGIQALLGAMGFVPMGDLFTDNLVEVQKTVAVISELIKTRKQDLDEKNRFHEERNRADQSRALMQKQLEQANGRIKALEWELTNIQGKIKQTEQIQYQTNQKQQAEIDEKTKIIIQMESKIKGFLHQFLQKDTQIEIQRENLRKNNGMKNQFFKNAKEVLLSFAQDQGQYLLALNGEHEFSQLIMNRWKDINRNLQQENQYLKEVIQRIHLQLTDILIVRQQIYSKRMKTTDDEVDENYTQFKPEQLKGAYEKNAKQAVKQLEVNLEAFKKQMEKFDNSYDLVIEDQQPSEKTGAKIKVCKDLETIFKNYNYVFEKQDRIINVIISKMNGIKNPQELSYKLTNRSRVMDDQYAEEVKEYLANQERYLFEAKGEMDLIKIQFQQQLKKREEEKLIIQQRKRQLDELNDAFNENIRQLESLNIETQQRILNE